MDNEKKDEEETTDDHSQVKQSSDQPVEGDPDADTGEGVSSEMPATG
jgi:hypothetical protein